MTPSNYTKTSLLSKKGLSYLFPDIADSIATKKKSASEFKTFGSEKLKTGLLLGGASLMGNVSPFLSTVLTTMAQRRQESMDAASNAYGNLSDKDRGELQEKFKGKNVQKELFEVSREFERLRSMDGEDALKNSDVYKEFGKYFETEKKKSSSSFSDNSDTSNNSEVIDRLDKIDSNTSNIASTIEKHTSQYEAQKETENNRVETLLDLAAETEKTSPEVSEKLLAMAEIIEKNVIQPAQSPLSLAPRENPYDDVEQAREQALIERKESDETQDILKDIRDILLDKKKEDQEKSGGGLLDKLKNSLPGGFGGGRGRTPGGMRKPNLPTTNPQTGPKPQSKSTIGQRVSGAVKGIGDKVTTVKDGAKVAAKGLGKSFIKKIPIIGALAGLGFAGSRLMDGDYAGAGMEAMSGLAGTIPGIGTAASVGIDAALAARDMSEENNDNILPTEKTKEESLVGKASASSLDITEKDGMFYVNGESVSSMDEAKAVEVYEKLQKERERAVNSNNSKEANKIDGAMLEIRESNSSEIQGLLEKQFYESTGGDATEAQPMKIDIRGTSADMVAGKQSPVSNAVDKTKTIAGSSEIQERMKMLKAAEKPIVINNNGGNSNRVPPSAPSSGGAITVPSIRGKESTLHSAHERDVWGRAQ